MNRPGQVTLIKEMAVTHGEFARTFARMFPEHAAHWVTSTQGMSLQVPWGSGTVQVALGAESERRLAMMRLPQTGVTLVFDAVTADERAAFLNLFDRRFQRGGG